jgi:hypothetical protein
MDMHKNGRLTPHGREHHQVGHGIPAILAAPDASKLMTDLPFNPCSSRLADLEPTGC